MKVKEIILKIYLLKDIHLDEVTKHINQLIDEVLAIDPLWKDFHNENKFKNYCFDSLYPLEQDKIYKKGNIYTIRIRTIDTNLANLLNDKLCNIHNEKIKCLVTDMKIIAKKPIEKIYSITPAILKDEKGYWKSNLSMNDFEKRLRSNLIKKYNNFNNTQIDKDFELYTSIEFKNKKPCKIKYKDITLLGDKISLEISSDSLAQEIAYMALGTGILEFNSRGGGFVNFRWI